MYIKAFLMKLLITTAILWVVLDLFYKVNFTDVFITSIVITVVGFISDVFLLPRIGNVLAAIGDFVLVLALIWILGSSIFDETIALGSAAFISALVIMMGELYLHRYMESRIFEANISNPDEKTGYYQRTNLQTEFAEDMELDEVTRKIREREGKPSPKKVYKSYKK